MLLCCREPIARTHARTHTDTHQGHVGHENGHGVGLVVPEYEGLGDEVAAGHNVLEGCGHDIPAGVVAVTVATTV